MLDRNELGQYYDPVTGLFVSSPLNFQPEQKPEQQQEKPVEEKKEEQHVEQTEEQQAAPEQQIEQLERAREADKTFLTEPRQGQINAKYAGENITADDLTARAAAAHVEYASKYPNGVVFADSGHPDFTPYAVAEVRLEQISERKDADKDFDAADKMLADELGVSVKTLELLEKAYVWHHCEDTKTLQLIPRDVHETLRHEGGVALEQKGLHYPLGHVQEMAKGIEAVGGDPNLYTTENLSRLRANEDVAVSPRLKEVIAVAERVQEYLKEETAARDEHALTKEEQAELSKIIVTHQVNEVDYAAAMQQSAPAINLPETKEEWLGQRQGQIADYIEHKAQAENQLDARMMAVMEEAPEYQEMPPAWQCSRFALFPLELARGIV